MRYLRLAVVRVAILILVGCGGSDSAVVQPTTAPMPATVAARSTAGTEVKSEPTLLADEATPEPTAVRSCEGVACTGTDPKQTGCEENWYTRQGVDVVDPDGAVLAQLELRESFTCAVRGGTQWARVVPAEAGSAGYSYELQAEQPATGYVSPVEKYSGGVGAIWTTQIHSPDACVQARVRVFKGEALVAEQNTDCF